MLVCITDRNDPSHTVPSEFKNEATYRTCSSAASEIMLRHKVHTGTGVRAVCQGTTAFTAQHAPHTAFKQEGHDCRHRISENLAEHVGTEHFGAELMSTSVGPSGPQLT
jgi:hypothetical protein